MSYYRRNMVILNADDVRRKIEDLVDELTELDPDDDRSDLEGELAEWRDALEVMHEYESLIHEDDMKQYAQQLADDLGLRTDGWPYDAIDWDKAVHDLLVDYRTVEAGGDVYYTRS